MDILLINPYYTQTADYYSFYQPAPPIGLLYLAAYLRKYGKPCKVYEFGIFDVKDSVKLGKRVRFGISDEQIMRILQEEKPKVVGITNMYSIYYRDVIEIADTVKKYSPQTQVVVGGNHASSYWKHLLKNKSVDFVAIGEGEETFRELTEKLIQRTSVQEISGIAFRGSDGQAKRTKPRELIKDIDSLPVPAWDMIEYTKYLSNSNPYSMRRPGTGIVSSRGCPGSCVYCTVQAVWGRTWRGRSPKVVVDEIEFLKKTYGIQEFAFLDDSASVDKKRWMGICDEIINRKLDIKWSTPNGIAHWTLTKEIVKKMQQAGCYRITFGIESGNVETRKFLGKPFSLDQAKEIIQYANRIGLWTICTNIIGFPYENLNSIRETIEFAKKCGTDFACFFLLIPQPTSDVYQYFKKEGLLNFDRFLESEVFDESEFERINYILNETGCDTVNFKKEELSRLQKQAYREFIMYRTMTYLLNPLKLIRKIHDFEEFRYVLRIFGMGMGIFLRTFNRFYKKSSDYLYAKSKAATS